MIPLEDNFNDILGKAKRGLGLSNEQLTAQAGVSEAELASVLEGNFDEGVVRKLVGPLQLRADALAENARKSWHPQVAEIDGLRQFNTTYADMTVNAYLVWDPASKKAVVFDTGAHTGKLRKFAASEGLKIELILITHTHGDHIEDLERLKQETGAPAFVCGLEPLDLAESFDAGKPFTVGKLKIETRQTSGHSKGGITFVVHGLSQPVAVVGDAMFAGSMGGGMVSYADALRNNREQIMTLPNNTILCCGHGPLTTVAAEKQHNPFFPEFSK
jgi:glyoxylase-like metal-dependent hydrolase (beta-lactamase superfamily II)